MANQPKQFHEGYWYHVYVRAQEEVFLFESDDEREWFVDKLDEVFDRRDVGIGALCLMDTHYHALARMGSVPLDRALNGLHMSYVKYVNAKRGREGSLFRKHPGTDIILDDKYLLQVVPYIHKNPIDAGIVENPEDYEWQTDALYRGGEWEPGPLESWRWPPGFEENPSKVYRERMGEDVDEPNRKEGFIGTEDEWEQLEKRKTDRKDRPPEERGRTAKDEIVEDVLGERDLSPEDLRESGRSQPEAGLRQQAMVRMYEEGYGPTEIGEYFNRTKGSVMYAVRKDEDSE